MLRLVSRVFVVLLGCACGAVQASVRLYLDRDAFFAATGSAQVTPAYPAITTGPYAAGPVTFSRAAGAGGLVFAGWTTLLPGNELAISGVENLDLSFAAPYFHAAGIDIVEPSAAGMAGCNTPTCIDSIFEFSVLGVPSGLTPATPRVLHTVQVNVPDDTAAFVGFASDQLITGIRVRELVGSDDNEFFGAVWATNRRAGSIPVGHRPQIEVFTTPLEGVVPFDGAFDFDLMPGPGQGSYRAAHLAGLDLVSVADPWVLHTAPGLGGNVARVPADEEQWRISLPPGTHAVELPLWESSVAGVGGTTCFRTPCLQTAYWLRAYNGSTLLRTLRVLPWDDRFNRIRLWSSVPIDQIQFDALVNTADDEFLGDIRFGSTPLPTGYVQREASTGERALGLAVALHGERALAAHVDGVLAWRRVAARWERDGNIPSAQTPVAVDLDEDHAVVATAGTLRVFRLLGDSATDWPELKSFTLPERPAAVRIDGDLIAAGYPGREEVGLFRRQPDGSWATAAPLQADPPIVGASGFGSGIDLAGGLLGVSADRNAYHLFQLSSTAAATELLRNSLLDAIGIPGIAVAPSRMVKARFGGQLLDHAPDAGGQWQGLGFFDAPLPFVASGYSGAGVRQSGAAVAALGQFTIPDTPAFVGALRLWNLGDAGWVPLVTLPDPFFDPAVATGFGANGDAVDIDGDTYIVGQTRPPYCQDVTGVGWTGDNEPGPIPCAAPTGMLHFGSVAGWARIFADGFD